MASTQSLTVSQRSGRLCICTAILIEVLQIRDLVFIVHSYMPYKSDKTILCDALTKSRFEVERYLSDNQHLGVDKKFIRLRLMNNEGLKMYMMYKSGCNSMKYSGVVYMFSRHTSEDRYDSSMLPYSSMMINSNDIFIKTMYDDVRKILDCMIRNELSRHECRRH